MITCAAALLLCASRAAVQDSRPSAPASAIVLEEVDPKAAGIDFEHNMGKSGVKFLVETMSSGLAAFDADGDGTVDLYFLQGAPMPGCAPFDARSRFYLNGGAWKFADATESSGLAHGAYALGAAVGDIENDGDLDVYVSAYGHGKLFKNRGPAQFEDATAASGISAEGFYSSTAFGDLDNDGLVDLYIVNYVDYAQAKTNPFCGKHTPGGRAYCTPHIYNGGKDALYRNAGGGRFENISEKAGVARAGRFDGKGLGVVLSDLDDDGDLEIVVANDSCANFLYRNDGGMKFEEVGPIAGVAFAEDGRERAGMGIDAADLDGDLRPEVFITNLNAEPNSLFRNLGKLRFEDAGGVSRLGPPSVPFVGFGCALVDWDGDGDRDVLVANGHILDNAELFGDVSPYKQRPLLFENEGRGRFRRLPPTSPFLTTTRVLRGLSIADLDGDGDPDAAATASEGAPVLLQNRSTGSTSWVGIRLRGKPSNAAGIGARVRWSRGGVESVAECRTGFSYMSASQPEVLVPLDTARALDWIEVRWPSGMVDRWSTPKFPTAQAQLVESTGPASRPSR